MNEVENDFARKVADRINKPDDPAYDQFASDIRSLKRYKFLKESWNLT
jgi:hypothetical protein